MTPEQFDILYERYATGRLTPEEGASLRACLPDPAWQRRWRDVSDLDGMLAGEFRVSAQEAAPVPIPPEGDAERRAAAISHRSLARATRLRRATGRPGPAGPVWLAAAVAALLLIGFAVWLKNGARQASIPRPSEGAHPEVMTEADTTREIDRLTAERQRLRERLDALEREHMRVAATPVVRSPDTATPAARERDLARIEHDRKTVEEEMARTVEAMRKVRAGTPETARPDPPPATADGRPPAPPPDIAETAAALASIENVEGVVWLESPPGERSAARAGAPVLAGSGISTEGRKGRATVVFTDRTCVKLGGETRIARIEEAPPAATGAGKRIHLAAGTLVVDAARQPKDRPLVVATPHAKAIVMGTRFTIAADAAQTQLQVESGEVRLGNAHGAVPVRAGQASSATATAAPAAPSDFRPAGWWPLDEGAGKTVADASGARRRAVLAGGPLWCEGRTGSGLRLDGIDDYIEIPGGTLLRGRAGTVAIWVRFPPGSFPHGHSLIGKHATDGSLNGFHLHMQDGRAHVQIKNRQGHVSVIRGLNRMDDGAWHHLALTYRSAGPAILYVDGKAQNTSSILAIDGVEQGKRNAIVAFDMTAAPLRIGRSTDPYWKPLACDIDDVRVYERILTTAEIRRLASP
jgi:ferric-dicitrate binding protein FerR (iron transport regulator)